jgi:hypothetical protein
MMNVRKCHLRKSQHEEALAFRHLCIQHCCTIFFFNWTIYYGSWKHALKIPTNMHTKIVMWTRVRFVCVLESSLLKIWSKIQAQIFQILGLEQKEKLKDFFSSYCDRQKKGLFSISQSSLCAWVAQQWCHWHGRGALSIIYLPSRPRVGAYSVHAMDTNKIETSTYRWVWYQCGSQKGLLMQVWCCCLLFKVSLWMLIKRKASWNVEHTHPPNNN